MERLTRFASGHYVYWGEEATCLLDTEESCVLSRKDVAFVLVKKDPIITNPITIEWQRVLLLERASVANRFIYRLRTHCCSSPILLRLLLLDPSQLSGGYEKYEHEDNNFAPIPPTCSMYSHASCTNVVPLLFVEHTVHVLPSFHLSSSTSRRSSSFT